MLLAGPSWLMHRPSGLPRLVSARPRCGDILSGSTRHPWRASYFLLRGQEKVSKEKATPHSRLAHSPCAPGARACSGVRRQSIRGLASNWPTSCGPSFGQFLRSLAAIEGPHIARIVRAKAKSKAPRQLLLRCSRRLFPTPFYRIHPWMRTSCIHAVVIRPAGHLLPLLREKEMPEQS